MGLLDWLTSDLGGSGGGPSPGAMTNPMGDITGADPMIAPPSAPPPMAPPPAPDGMAPPAPSPSLAEGAGAPPPLPPPVNVPPRGAPDASMLPPNATSTSGSGMPPPPMALSPSGAGDIAQSYQRAGGNLAPPEAVPSAQGPLGRALGMDVNRERSFKGSLAAGLKSVGENYNKPGLAAASGSAGAAIEGGQKAADTGYEQRQKALRLAVEANAAGDKAAYNKNYAAYLGKKLEADTEKAAGGGKGSTWNKPDSQKFLDAQRGVSRDPNVLASLKGLEALQKTGSPEEIAAAKLAHEGLVSSTEQKYLVGVGLDPKKAIDMVKNPPGSQTNPHAITTKADFDIYVKPGQAYINPADGKVYIRKGADGASPTGGAPTPPAAPQPPRLPTSPTLDDEE